MEFSVVWDRIKRCEGELFHTVSGIPFTFRVVGNSVVPVHTGFPLSMSNFKKVHDMGEISGPGQISRKVMGSAYVYAILTDDRVK